MRRSLPSALALCLCLLLSACAPRTQTSHSGGSAAQPPEGGSSSQTEPQAPSGSGEEGPEEPGELPVEGDYAPEELLEQEGSYDYFEADGGEWQVKLVFTARERVTDLKYVTLDLDYYDESGALSYGVGETLYTQAELTPERPLVVGMVFYGDVASRGLTFVDGQGEFHCVSIGMSGEDGSILLVEEDLPAPQG